jgi:ribosome-associated protein
MTARRASPAHRSATDLADAPEPVHGSGLTVRPGVVIPESELEVRRSRSGGPGGQNVNKVSTRVEIAFDVAVSTAFDDEEKERLQTRLRGRSSRAGVVRVVGQRYRSQARNEEDARQRLAELLDAALVVPKPRRKTRPSKRDKAERLAGKRHRATIKSNRRTPAVDE